MFDYLFNTQANPPAPKGSVCANCANAELVTDASIMVQGEPWCGGCVEAICVSCECCDAIVESDDCEHGERGDYVCYTCGQKETCQLCGALYDTAGPSCVDCINDCAHQYDDDALECVRCGFCPPTPGAHLRLVLGGAK